MSAATDYLISTYERLETAERALAGVDLNALPAAVFYPTNIALENVRDAMKQCRVRLEVEGVWTTAR